MTAPIDPKLAAWAEKHGPAHAEGRKLGAEAIDELAEIIIRASVEKAFHSLFRASMPDRQDPAPQAWPYGAWAVVRFDTP